MIPFRVCCGQQHLGVQCPDGLVMCCICFERFSTTDLSRNINGDLEDVCKKCAEEEDFAMNTEGS